MMIKNIKLFSFGIKNPDCLLTVGSDEKILENKKSENHKF